MKPQATFLLALLCSSTTVLANDFDEVLRRAEQSEGALDPGQMVRLVDAQGSAMQRALTKCTPRGETIPDAFAIVLRIEADGQPVDAWTRNESEFERCFAASMREAFHYEPPAAPFYTSIDYRRARLDGAGHDSAGN